jgi:hypothetical protein
VSFTLTGVAPLASALPSPLKVVPGDEAVCQVRIRNTGTVVDKYSFEVLGAAAMWTQVTPAVLHLFPGTEGPVELHLNPPRLPTPPAGPMPFGLKVSSIEQIGEPAVQEGSLEIAPFGDTKAELRPRTALTWRSVVYRLSIANEGNVAVDIAPRASDPDELLTFDVPGVARLQPGGKLEGGLRARTRKLLPAGRNEPRPFQVVVDSRAVPEGSATPAEPVALEGTLLQRPLVAWWVLLIPPALVALRAIDVSPGVIALLVVVALAAFVVQLLRGARRSAPR